MMVPSIDIQNGRAVQLVNGERLCLDAGSVREAAERFSILGELAVVDLDAAMGKGSNRGLLLELAKRYPCRLGGGFRSKDDITQALDSGAVAVMLGTNANPELVSAFPRERIIAALDARGDILMTEGWKRNAGTGVLSRALALAPYAGAFLFTDIGREGTKCGIDINRARAFKEALNQAGYSGRIIMAGGTNSEDDIATLDTLGMDAQVGMGLYDGSISPARALAACMKSDRPDGLWPTLVCDESGKALGLTYSDEESLTLAMDEKAGIYHSRRAGLWRKGQS
ncbi:MAG TPA: HisA/HisF-related TIM barrel protein, partial [Spirochaetales bacterium]|nr:HisA/HisF-related TIM barrel protein [Spirochaetales bacterium]